MCVQKFIVLTKTEGENKSTVKTRETRNIDRLGEIEQVGEENESGRQLNTYVTSACAFRSLSFEPDVEKDSAPVSSTPSKRHNGGKAHKKKRILCVNLFMRNTNTSVILMQNCKYWTMVHMCARLSCRNHAYVV